MIAAGVILFCLVVLISMIGLICETVSRESCERERREVRKQIAEERARARMTKPPPGKT